MPNPFDIPPARLAAIDQDLAELERRLKLLVEGTRTVAHRWDVPTTHMFLTLAAGVRQAVADHDDNNTTQLLLSLAVLRLAEAGYR